MRRRPNANGGKYNDHSKKPQTSRARFSHWAPMKSSSKSIDQKFIKQVLGEGGPDGKDNDPGSKQETLPFYQTIILEDVLINELMSILGEPGVDEMLSSKISVSNTKSSKPVESLPFTIVKPNQQNMTPQELEAQKQYDLFINLGFTSEEIFRIKSLTSESLTNDELFLSLLQLLCDPSPTNLLIQNSIHHSMESLSNTEINSELEILESIYGTLTTNYSPNYSSTTISCPNHLGVFTTQLNLFQGVPVTRIELIALDHDGLHVLQIVMYIINSSSYPQDSAKLYGWLIPQQQPTTTTTMIREKSQLLMKSIPPELSREISLENITIIHERQVEFQSPVLFDFIQSILTSCSLKGTQSSSSSSDLSTLRKDETKNKARQGKNGSKEVNAPSLPQPPPSRPVPIPLPSSSSSSSKTSTSTTQDKSNAESTPTIPPPLVKPLTKVMEGKEYREAYLQALNTGLKGKEAKRHAREILEYILPTSAMESLAIEEKYAEDVLERAFSIENFTPRNIVEGTKMLADRLNINKSHAKELFVTGKDVLYQSGDWYARELPLLLERCVAKAIQIHRERIERKEKARLEKMENREANRGKILTEDEQIRAKSSRWKNQRGPTIRDAYGAIINSPSDDSPTTDSEQQQDQQQQRRQQRQEGDDYQQEQQLTFEEQQRENERRAAESHRMKMNFLSKQNVPIYQEMKKKRESLPAYMMRAEILQVILNNNVTVISGDTGCGKTTQIPQLVLDYFIENDGGADCNIIVTQPRRISALSVAEHISRERAEQIGQSVGYQIRLESKQSSATRLLLMTTGILLRRLQDDLGDVSHLFIDEVHERDINTDFLLVIVKQLLITRPHLKIILMSATLNANLFRDYFHNSSSSMGQTSCALITIPGRTFPVETFYLEDALEHTRFEISSESEYALKINKSRNNNQILDIKKSRLGHLQNLRNSRQYSPKTIQSVGCVDECILNLQLIQKLVVYLLSRPLEGSSGPRGGAGGGGGGRGGGGAKSEDPMSSMGSGAVLIFVSGLSEIREVINCLRSCPELSGKGNSRWQTRILPLHSSLSTAEQNLVFQIYPSNIRKIIVSTNIAETSVTIEDVVYVIDTCRVKENRYDEESQINVLEEQWASQANLQQRRGRAGRVRSGVCYHLACKFMIDEFPEFSIPEMLRMSLEDVILQVLALDLGDPYEFLHEALTPPNSGSITNAILYLESLNAITIENYDPSQRILNPFTSCLQFTAEITPLGYHLATLPLSPRLGKLLLFSVLLQCVDPILTIASIISTKSPFIVSFHDNKSTADEAKLQFLTSQSDLLTTLTAYQAWYDRYGEFSPNRLTFQNGREAKQHELTWCQNNSLSLTSLKLIEQMRQQYFHLLQEIQFISSDETFQSFVLDSIALSSSTSSSTLSTSSSSPSPSGLNYYSGNIAIIKCALCCGLSPNILTLPAYSLESLSPHSFSTGIKKLSQISLTKSLAEYPFQSKYADIPIFIHSNSLLNKLSSLDSSILLYVDGLKTNKRYCYDLLTIPIISLILFSGRLTYSERFNLLTIDGWLKFQTNKQTRVCLARLITLFDEIFLEKVLNPSSVVIPDKWREVLRVLSRVIAA